ncbi:MAG: hypothetical protein ACYSSL_01485 [Planctomycetota bacterium]
MAKRIIIGGVTAVALIVVASLIIQRKGGGLEVGQKQQPSTEQRIFQESLEEQAVPEDVETAEEAAARKRIEAIRRGREAMRSGEDTFGGELLRKRFGASARQTGEPNASTGEQE